jgi:hypothetical protein
VLGTRNGCFANAKLKLKNKSERFKDGRELFLSLLLFLMFIFRLDKKSGLVKNNCVLAVKMIL